MISFSGIHGNLWQCNSLYQIKTYQLLVFLEVKNIEQYLFWWFKNFISKTRLLTDLIPGKFKRDPRTGTLLIKPITTGKKPLGRRKNRFSELTYSLLPKSIANQVERKDPVKILSVLETSNFMLPLVVMFLSASWIWSFLIMLL